MSILKKKRGLSGTVAAAFLATVIVLAFNLTVLGANLLALNSQQVAQRNQLANDKAAESLVFLGVEIVNKQLNLTVYNAGGVSINIVRFWVTNSTSNPKWHGKVDKNFWLDSGGVLGGIGLGTGLYNASANYLFNLITSRGNSFQTTYTPSNTIVATVQGVGWISVDWSSYKYTYSTNGGPDQGPFNGWCVPGISSTYYQFTATAMNHANVNITLISWTYVKFASNGGSDTAFFLMDPSSTAQNPVAYSTNTISLHANPSDPQTGGTPVPLKFFATTPGGSGKQTFSLGDYSVLIVFFFQYHDGQGWHTLGQTVPYEGTAVVTSC